MAAFPSVSLAILPMALLLNAALSLEMHFYRNSCPRAEVAVKTIVQNYFSIDPSIPAGLLRLHFHDCFIRGCDGSVLIDSRGDEIAEKEAPPNLSLRGFGIIDEIKAELEKQCPKIVSCADILALATRDGVALAGGSAYALPTGRRDGTVSNVSEVNIPGPSSSITSALEAFNTINLGLDDLTTLLGAHGIGFCHCGFFLDRLYNFRGSGLSDPDMDEAFVANLKSKCPRQLNQVFNLSSDNTVFMNPASSSPFILDGSFYKSVLNEQAILQLDQELAFTDITRNMAAEYANRPHLFHKKFAKAMIKLGNVGVLTGQEGEIRLDCRRVNKRPHHFNFAKTIDSHAYSAILLD